MKTGEAVILYTLKNSSGMEITVTNYGARLVSVKVPGKDKKIRDVVLGYDNVQGYEADANCFGATIGRNANRIKNAEFVLNGKKYFLSRNEYENNSHSGPDGYQSRLWKTIEVEDTYVRFLLVSPDGDQGFPGEFTVTTTYRLTQENEVFIEFEGVCTADTIVNMTHHSYFNLNGHESGPVLDQFLRIYANEYSPVADDRWIPTGKHVNVTGTSMDFTSFKKIGRDFGSDCRQLKISGDYNHNFILDKKKNEMGIMAQAYGEESGICMKAYANLPAMQLYTGSYIDNVVGKQDCVYGKCSGFCLEAQYTPNAVNEEQEEKPILHAGEKYDKTIMYQFGCLE